jgi:hypothetical protein
VTTFVFGLPSILAVIINRMNQNDARGTFLESHFRGQIRSFWFANWDRRRSGRMRPAADRQAPKKAGYQAAAFNPRPGIHQLQVRAR